jgi:hypothetical protein
MQRVTLSVLISLFDVSIYVPDVNPDNSMVISVKRIHDKSVQADVVQDTS